MKSKYTIGARAWNCKSLLGIWEGQTDLGVIEFSGNTMLGYIFVKERAAGKSAKK